MTTIAWDGKTLASDSRATVCGSIVDFNREKIVSIAGIGLVGFAGKFNLFYHFCEWLKAGKPDNTKLDFGEFDAVVIGSSSYLLFTGDPFPETIPLSQKMTIGSGANLAMSAMDLGKSAAEAVEYACTRDVYSALPVVAVDA